MAMNFDSRYADVSTGDELRLSDYLAAVLGNWKLVTVVMLAVVALGTAYAFIVTPTYKADALIQVEETNPQQQSQRERQCGAGRLAADVRREVDHCRADRAPALAPRRRRHGASPASRRAALRDAEGSLDKKFTLVAGENGSYVLNDPDGVAILTGRVGQEASGVTQQGPVKLKVDKLVGNPSVQFELQRFSTLTTIDALQKRLTVAETALQSGIIGVSLEGSNPKEIAQIVNKHCANRYVAQDAEKRSAEAEHTLAFLDQQLPILKKQLDESEQKYNSFRNKQGTVDLSEESRLLLQQIVDNKTKLTDLQQQRAELSLRFTANHPSVQALDAQIAALTGAQTRLGKNVSTLPDT